MVKKIYLHIGLHKTGSTSVQAHLARNAAALSDAGVLYPTSGRAGGGHANLYWELVGHKRFRLASGGWDDLLAEIADSDASKVVVSAEGLGLLEHDDVRRVAEMVAGLDPTIVVYLRRQDQLVQSVFSQRVKHGMTKEFARFVEKESSQRLYRFYDLLAAWSTVFGNSALRIRVYEPEQLVGGDLIADFLDAIDMSHIADALSSARRLNESATPEGVAVIQRIAALRKARNDFDGLEFAHTVGKAVAVCSREVEWGTEGSSFMDTTSARRFLDSFGVQNSKVARELLGRQDGVLFRREPDPRPVPATMDVGDLDPAALVDLLDRVVSLIESDPGNPRRAKGRKGSSGGTGEA